MGWESIYETCNLSSICGGKVKCGNRRELQVHMLSGCTSFNKQTDNVTARIQKIQAPNKIGNTTVMGRGVWHLSLASIFLHLTSLLILEEFQLRMQNGMSISLKMFTMRCKPTVISCYKKFQSVIKLLLFSPESFSVGVGGMKFEQLLERFRGSCRRESGPSTRIGPAPGLM